MLTFISRLTIIHIYAFSSLFSPNNCCLCKMEDPASSERWEMTLGMLFSQDIPVGQRHLPNKNSRRVSLRIGVDIELPSGLKSF